MGRWPESLRHAFCDDPTRFPFKLCPYRVIMAKFIQCSCRKRIPVSRLLIHRRSILHRQRNRLLQLLAQPHVTFREIARQTGVSHERIRQIAAEVGMIRPRLYTLDPPLVTGFKGPRRFKD